MLGTKTPKLSQIQRPVRDLLDGVVHELRRIVMTDFAAIEEVSNHLLWSRGKLFRPTLLLLANRLGDRPHPRVVTLAAIVELVHLATLVHDDAVDHSVLRRGMPTVNALWNHQTAVIVGDYLYSRSVTELATFGSTDLIEVLGGAANEMSIGELRQLVSHDALGFTEQDYDLLIASKTASLMAAACEMGCAVGQPELREPLRRYGHALGMAFQIADDLIDYTEAEAVSGKPGGQDLREHKVTLPLIHSLQVMSEAGRREVGNFFAEPVPTDDGIARVIELVVENRGLEYARQRAARFGEQAAEALADLPPGETADGLVDAIHYVIERRR
ncbi:MAG: polyprenyl synthetase family protein [Longimicrobiales bacterium]